MNIALMLIGFGLFLMGLVGFFKENIIVKNNEIRQELFTGVTVIDGKTNWRTDYTSAQEIFKNYELQKRKSTGTREGR